MECLSPYLLNARIMGSNHTDRIRTPAILPIKLSACVKKVHRCNGHYPESSMPICNPRDLTAGVSFQHRRFYCGEGMIRTSIRTLVSVVLPCRAFSVYHFATSPCPRADLKQPGHF